MGTTLKEQVPGWYIQFQAALLQSAPRPGEISKETAVAWSNGQAALKQQLAGLAEYRTDVAEPPYRAGNVDNLVMNHEGDSVVPEPKWREVDGVIYFSVTSDGTTGEAWIDRLEQKGFRSSYDAKQLLCSKSFKPTSGVTTQVAVLKGELFADNERYTKTIHANATKRKWKKPNAEIVCLIREKFSDEELEEMGLWVIIAMHDPVKDSCGDLFLLAAFRSGDGRCLSACYGNPGGQWGCDGGFAFAVSQSPST